MKKLLYLATACGLMVSLATAVSAQKNLVSVNTLTGSGNVSIPLYTVKSGAVELPVSLFYHGNGVKVKDVEGTAGMNWDVVAGGQVSRAVRGIPDDNVYNMSGIHQYGWLNNSNASGINSFTIANNSPSSTCSDGATDRSNINSYVQYSADTEPDVFNVSAPGLSCQLMFDNSHNIKVIPYQDLKVSYATNAGGAIISFTIVNDKGMTYYFASPESATKYATFSGATTSYYQQETSLYAGGQSFNSAWKLSSITDINGNYIQLFYTSLDTQGYRVPFYLYPGGSSSRVLQCNWDGTYSRIALADVYTGNTDDVPVLALSFTSSATTGGPLYSSVSGYGINTTLQYTPLTYNSSYSRQFLSKVTIGPKSYTLDYIGNTGGSIALPDSSSNDIDLWGYYNGSGATTLKPNVYINTTGSSLERYRYLDPGASTSSYTATISGTTRSVNTTNVKIGTLTTIGYSEGGSTTLDWESNDFYDPTAGAVINGGGIRIKTITDHDGISSGNDMVRNYAYLQPGTSTSSGKPVSLPIYAFTTPADPVNPAVKWDHSTVRSEDDLSGEDESIIYQYVTVSRTGAGSTLYEYYTPATNWDTSASPADATLSSDWSPTIVSTTKSDCSTTTSTYAVNDKNTYPFPPNINYDHERGLIKKVTNFDDAGHEVNEANYTYTRSGSPDIITGFVYGQNGENVSYAKYQVYASTSELTKTITNKVFDITAGGTVSTTGYKQTSTTLNYASTAHRLLTSQEITNSDGSIRRTFVKYVKDYAASSGTDANSIALYHLQLLNYNGQVERYTQVERGGVNKTYSGELTTFKTFTFPLSSDHYLPEKHLGFVAGAGLNSGSYQPSSVASGSFSYYSGYINNSNSLIYDNAGYLQTADDNNHHIATTLMDHSSGQTVATILNARADGIAFSDFDTYIPGANFTAASGSSGSSTNVNGRLGACLSVTSSSILEKVIQKDPLALSYTFSVWVNAASSGTLTVSLNNGVTTYSYYLSYPATSGAWKYQSLKLPLNGMSSSFTLHIQSSNSILMDDILCYPSHATVSTASYDPLSFNVLAQTNTNGISTYYEYDAFNRLRFVYDQDKAIVKKMSYVDFPSVGQYVTPAISYSGPGNYGSPLTFVNGNAPSGINTDGLNYTWDFGDSTSPVTATSYNGSTSHTYSSAGTYTVALTMASPLYGTKTTSSSVTITSGSPTPVALYGSSLPGGGGTLTGLDVYDSTNTTLLYSFTGSQVEAGAQTIPQGVYSMRVYATGTAYNPSTATGYKRIAMSINGTYADCNAAFSDGPQSYYFYVDLNGKTSIRFDVDDVNDCSLTLPPL